MRRGFRQCQSRRTGHRRTGPRRSGQSGAAIIESSFVIMPTLILIFGLVEFALIFSIGSNVQHAADVAMKTASVTHLEDTPLTTDDLIASAEAVTMPFARACLTISGTEYPTLEDYGADMGGVAVIPGVTELGNGGLMQIGEFTLTCNWPFMLPFLGRIAGHDTFPLGARFVVRYEDPL